MTCRVPFVLLAGLCSLVLVLLVIWLMIFEYGRECCGWKTFGLHAVCMTLAFGMFSPLSSLTFLLETFSRPTRKRLHAAGHGCAVVLALIGLATEWILHSGEGESHLNSAHSWIGLLTVTFYCAQWGAGGATFLLNAPAKLRQRFLPTHVFSGLCLVSCGLLSIITGLMSHLRRKAHAGELRFDIWNWASIAAVAVMVTTYGALYTPYRAAPPEKKLETSSDSATESEEAQHF